MGPTGDGQRGSEVAGLCQAGASVLYVEDDESIRDVMALILEDEGFEVHACVTAEEGLERMRDQHYDVVLTDQNLPGNSGAWLLETARQDGLLRCCAGLVLTACSGPIDLDPVFPVLRKPVEFEDLLGAVRQAAARSRAVSPGPPLRAEARRTRRPFQRAESDTG